MKGEECNGFRYGDRELKNIEERIKTIKKEDRWLDITEDKIYLKEDWDPYNAKWLICLYLSDLEGYICYQWTALGCKQCIEDYDKSVHFSVASCFHPHGYRLCPHCKKYGMVKLDRFPEAHDKVIFKYKIPSWNNDCGKPALYYKQMVQHEKVWRELIDKVLDPVWLQKIPFFTSDGKYVKLIDQEKLNTFYNKIDDYEKEELNITLNYGFRVCIIQGTNHVLIVGGVGSERSTFLFNSDTNLIEETKWELHIPRVAHSLWSSDNLVICTGTSVRGERDVDRQGCSTEVFSLEWGEWREGLEMYNERFDHCSVVLGDKVWAMFGNDPLNSGAPQDGIEYVALNQVTKDNTSWRYIDWWTKKALRVDPTHGFMPVPFSERIIIFASKRPEFSSFLMFGDREDFDDKPKPRMFINDPDDPTADVFKPIDYNAEKYTFDKNNTPFLYRGYFHVFGADGKLVYLCERGMTVPK